MRHFTIMAVLLALLAACGEKRETFEVCGTIEDAEGKTLYLDAMALRGIETIDSVQLKKGGAFTMHGSRPATPEFYRLRLGNETVNFCIDSTETVTFTATVGKMATDYKVEGSEACEQMRELALMQLQLRRDIDEIGSRNGMSPSQRHEAALARLEVYKKAVCEKFILTDPGSAVAYYTLFHSFADGMIFNPVNNRDDVRWFAAVATAWDYLYPDAERTQNLHNVALQGMANTRPTVINDTLPIDYSKIQVTGIIDMTLCDPNGNEHSLSELKGKVVLLDFTACVAPDYAQRTLAMRELYSKYHDSGLEIYQVSVDEDLHLWSMRASALPWVGVHIDDKTDLLTLYRVASVPTFFLIDRGSNLVCRDSEVKDIDKAIEALL